jgi:hypothetical protein
MTVRSAEYGITVAQQPRKRNNELISEQDIIEEIKRLPDDKKARVIEFVRSLDTDDWDREIAQDVRDGGMDRLAEAALNELRAGKTTPLPPDAQ